MNTSIPVDITHSRNFLRWLKAHNVALAVSTYKTSKLYFLGYNPETNKLSVFERTLERCMGLFSHGRSLYIGTRTAVWRFENILPNGQTHQGYDAVYTPKVMNVTGDVDVHDVLREESGRVLFVSTAFSCVAALSEEHSFVPVWIPSFINKLAPEDRCHLNGAGLRDGVLRYVTLVAPSNVNEGWRNQRNTGGQVIDIVTGEVVCDGLCMPHSPRWYQDRLWLHNAGTGEFGYVNMQAKRFVAIAFCPGYLRGLSFLGNYAIAGISRPRSEPTFNGLPLDENLKREGALPRCGLQVINLGNGDIEHTVTFEGLVEEIYDIAVLPEVSRPMLVGLKNDDIATIISLPQ